MIGEVLDGHEILRPLGAGGMGEVYLARTPAGELRALKLVRADQQSARQAASRFKREVLALGRLRHPGIVHILDAGELRSGALYLSMEYVAGPDLQSAVGWDGAFAVGDALRILAQLAGALAYAHEAGIVHRDLKPANVILENGDPARAKIIDFGLAKIAEEGGLTRLTEDRQALGSPLYWAPEQSSNADVGPAADVYALGGIAYFVLTREPMFSARPAVAMVYAHQHELPEVLSARCRSALPAGLDELIAGCVAKQPTDRPPAKDLVAALDRMLAQTPSSGRVRRSQRLFAVDPAAIVHSLSHASSTSGMVQALTSQIRQVLLDLASALERPTDDIERIQHEISELELDLAMLESELESAIDPEVVQRRDGVAAAVAQLQSGLADAFRELFDAVTNLRETAPADVEPLFVELYGLVDQYQSHT